MALLFPGGEIPPPSAPAGFSLQVHPSCTPGPAAGVPASVLCSSGAAWTEKPGGRENRRSRVSGSGRPAIAMALDILPVSPGFEAVREDAPPDLETVGAAQAQINRLSAGLQRRVDPLHRHGEEAFGALRIRPQRTGIRGPLCELA